MAKKKRSLKTYHNLSEYIRLNGSTKRSLARKYGVAPYAGGARQDARILARINKGGSHE